MSVASNSSQTLDIGLQVRRSLAERGDDDALAFGGRWRSWRWLAQSRNALDLILERAGLGPDVPVALIARNRPQHVAALVAQIAAHRTTCMVYSMQSAAAIAADIARLAAPVVLADRDDWTPELNEAVARLGAVGAMLIDEPAQGVHAHPQFTRLGAGPFATPRPTVGLELLSSGTTGAPKRIPLSWAAMTAAIADARLAYAGTEQREAPLLMVHPLGNIAGMAYLAPPVVYGQRIVLLEKFDVRQWAAAVHRYRPTRSSIPPVGLRMALEAAIAPTALASLKLLAVGGGKLDRELHERFEHTYGIPVLTAYGATEFGGVVANWTLPLYQQFGVSKRGSAGRASAGVQLRIVDRDTLIPLEPGKIGLLEAKVPRVGSDWIRTTDLATLDADGFLFLHGRADAAINRGGFKIVPEEVAEVLKTHTAVADAAVVGLADPRLGEVPVAAVELRPGAVATEESLKAFARDKLLAYQIPAAIRIVAALPRNASMKISIPEVRALLSALDTEAPRDKTPQ